MISLNNKCLDEYSGDVLPYKLLFTYITVETDGYNLVVG